MNKILIKVAIATLIFIIAVVMLVGGVKSEKSDSKYSMGNPTLYADKLIIYAGWIEGRPSITRYNVKKVSINSNGSTCISVETTDNKSIFATSYLIEDDTIYIKY